MPNAFIGPWTIEQYGDRVAVYYGGPNGWGNQLHQTWFGHAIGLTEPPEDEPAAHYAFTEAVKFLTKYEEEKKKHRIP